MPNQNKIVVLDLDDDNIDKFAKEMSSHGKVFIAFLADWCGHCQNFKPEWEKIKSHLKTNGAGSGHVITVNDKHMQKLPGKKPSGFPTLSLYKGKEHIKDYDGGRNMPEVLQFIKEHLGKKKHHTKHHTKHHKKKKRKHVTHKKHHKRGKHSNHKRRKMIFDSPATMASTDIFYRGGKRKRSKKRSRNKRKRKRQRTKRRRRSRRR
jgi:thiol-disulfide isomerase/thioredoxin